MYDEHMASLTLSSALVKLVSGEAATDRSPTTVSISARSWPEMAREIQERFPRLANKMLTDTGDVSPAFALVVNDEVIRRPSETTRLGADDQLYLLVAIAGG